MIVADTSLLIVLGRLNRFDLLQALFGQVFIPTSVFREAVTESNLQSQRHAILAAIEADMIVVVEPTESFTPHRRLDSGEIGVLQLALEHQAVAIIMDDKKARNEAKDLGFRLLYTTDILHGAEQRGLIDPYAEIVQELRKMKIFLPE